MAGAPMHPVDDPAELVRVLTEADLTGTGETPLASPFTVGNASKARAYAQATAPGDAMRGSSLLEAYARWKAEQASSITKAREATPADIEADALARSKRRVEKRLRKGAEPTDALRAGYKRYRSLGGTMRLATWHAKVVGSR